MISVTVPFHPVACSRPRFTKFGTVYIASTYAQFKTATSAFLKNYYRDNPLEGPLEVCVVFSLHKPKRPKNKLPIVKPDLDNYVKAILDCSNGILWKDDSQIVDLHAFKVYGEPSIILSVKIKGAEQ